MDRCCVLGRPTCADQHRVHLKSCIRSRYDLMPRDHSVAEQQDPDGQKAEQVLRTRHQARTEPWSIDGTLPLGTTRRCWSRARSASFCAEPLPCPACLACSHFETFSEVLLRPAAVFVLTDKDPVITQPRVRASAACLSLSRLRLPAADGAESVWRPGTSLVPRFTPAANALDAHRDSYYAACDCDDAGQIRSGRLASECE